MPRNITVTFGDGSTHVYQNAPDTITPSDVQARAQQDFGKPVTGIDGGNKQSQPSMIDKLKQAAPDALSAITAPASAIAEPLLHYGSAMVAKPISDIAGLAAAAKDLITGNKNGDPVGFKNEVQNSLTYDPKTKIGASNYNPINAAMNGIGSIVGAVSNKPADLITGNSSADSARGMIGNAVREAIPQALGFVGVKGAKSAAPIAAEALAKKQAALDVLKSQAQPANDVINASRDAGLVMPVSAANPTRVNKVIDAIGGKPLTNESASLKNQPTFNSLGRKALGIPDEVPLTPDAYDAVRADAGKAYEALKQVGHFSADKEFLGAIQNIEDKTKSTGNFSTLKNPGIDQLVGDLKKQNFDSSDAVALMRQLRSDSNSNLLNTSDPAKMSLGQAQKQAAKALEGLVDRNLADAEKYYPGNGYGDLAKNFTNARETIAKSYSLQKATDPVTGNLDPRMLARQLKAGKPVTGDIKTLAQFGSLLNKSSRNVARGSGPATNAILPTVLSAAGFGALGPAGIAAGFLPAIRPLTRAASLSDLGQKMLTQTPSYKVGALAKLLYGSSPTAVGLAGLSAPSSQSLAERLKRMQN